MKIFNLPDLGEGLPDAEIVEWLVSEGDEIKVDQPMVSMETAKAVVEVPSPYTGRVVKLYGQAGDVIEVDKPLISFDVEGDDDGDSGDYTAAAEADQVVAVAAAPAVEAPATDETSAEPTETPAERADTGTVVGKVDSATTILPEQMSSVGGVKVSPAVRALSLIHI